MDTRQLKELSKDDVAQLSKNLSRDEIRFLVEMLNEKDESIRCHASYCYNLTLAVFPSYTNTEITWKKNWKTQTPTNAAQA